MKTSVGKSHELANYPLLYWQPMKLSSRCLTLPGWPGLQYVIVVNAGVTCDRNSGLSGYRGE